MPAVISIAATVRRIAFLMGRVSFVGRGFSVAG